MPVNVPTIKKAAPGDPITVGAWNSIAGGIEGLYPALDEIRRSDYIEVALTYRRRPVTDARVVASLDGDARGRSIVAVAPIGDLRAFTLAGITAAKWTIAITARGFATQTIPLQIALKPAGPSASLSFELVPTTVPVPQLVGMSYTAAQNLVIWAGFRSGGSWRLFGPGRVDASSSTILIQGASGPQIERGGAVSTLYSPADVTPPDRTMVPDLLGYPGVWIPSTAQRFGLKLAPAAAPPAGQRVVRQDLRPGDLVPLQTPLTVVYAPINDTTTKFGAFTGTHPGVADSQVQPVAQKLKTTAGAGTEWAPWDVARTSVSPEYFDAVVTAFKAAGASADTDRDLEAIWRSLSVATHQGLPA